MGPNFCVVAIIGREVWMVALHRPWGGVSDAGLQQTSDATSTQINNIIFLAVVYLFTMR